MAKMPAGRPLLLAALFSTHRRAPIVTIMGHVDHGKTTLLDRLRSTNTALLEAGGITQHIGAFTVTSASGGIVFLDTPGHQAFSRMRHRGAKVCDVIVLVVAGDDGVMPQTREVIRLAKDLSIPMIVGVSKTDRCSEAMVRAVVDGLGVEGVEVEGSTGGGSVQLAKFSGLTGAGIDDLMDAILAESEMLDDQLACSHSKPGTGYVLETRKDVGRGAVSTVLLRDGSARVHDWMVAGDVVGRLKGAWDERSQPVASFHASQPVVCSGWRQVPPIGEEILITRSEQEARELAELIRQDRLAGLLQRHSSLSADICEQNRQLLQEYRQRLADRSKRVVKTLAYRESDKLPELSVIIKADVVGSAEAIVQAIRDIPQQKASVHVAACGIGPVTDSDLQLARACANPLVILFGQPLSKALAKQCAAGHVKIRAFTIIYSLLDAVADELRGLLPKTWTEHVVGSAAIRQLFQVNSKPPELVAGCRVTDGHLSTGRSGSGLHERIVFRVTRNDQMVWEGGLKSMRHGKAEVSKVVSGMECGLILDGLQCALVGDIVQQVKLTPSTPQLS